MDWSGAACVGADPEVFFRHEARRGLARGRDIDAANVFCAQCPVKVRCQQFAVDERIQYGIWGGMTVDDRRRFARRQRGNYRLKGVHGG